MILINADLHYNKARKALKAKIKELDNTQSTSLLIYQTLNGYETDLDENYQFIQKVQSLLDFLMQTHKEQSCTLLDSKKNISGVVFNRIYILSLPLIANSSKDSINIYKTESLKHIPLLEVLIIQYKNCLLKIVDV